MGTIQNWDKWLFRIVNEGFPTVGLDSFALFLSSGRTWWTSAAVFLGVSIVLKKKKWVQGIVIGALALGATDLISGQVLKPLFKRVRPCHEMTVQLRNTHCGSVFGLPSNHAGNGAAFFSASRVFLPFGVSSIVGMLALGVGWSRVYLGVHYPGDVLLGFLVGWVVGKSCVWIAMKINTYRGRFRVF